MCAVRRRYNFAIQTQEYIRYLQFCIESELMRIQDWFNANKLTLNVSKCSYLLFNTGSRGNNDFNLTLNNTNIPRVRSAKLLGTWIDDRLTWETHVKKTIDQATMWDRYATM